MGFEVELELPKTFGLGMAVPDVAETEPGEICEYDDEPQYSKDEEQRGDKQACQHMNEAFEAALVCLDLAAEGPLRAGNRHYIVNGLNWL